MKTSSKKILITGGTGFIGSHLIHKLLAKNYSIVLLKRKKSDTWRIKDILKKVKVYDVNLNTNFKKILRDESVYGIIHLATKHIKIHKNSSDIKKMNESNITFPTLLLNAAVNQNIQFFINTGTFTEYRLKGLISERTPLSPYNYYTATKVAFETILRYYEKQKKIKAITLKLFSPYGEKDINKIIPLLSKSFYEGKKLELTQGNQKLSFTYISDIVLAYEKTLTFFELNKYRKYETFNIGSNESWSIRELVKKLEKITKKTNCVEFGKKTFLRDDEVVIKCDVRKAKIMLQWQPKVKIMKGLKKTYSYFAN